MSAGYQFLLADCWGNPLGELHQRGAWALTRAINQVGALSPLILPETVPDAWLHQDAQLTINRQVDRAPWYREGTFLLDRTTHNETERTYQAEWSGALDVLDRRCVVFYADTTGSLKTGLPADNLIKAFARDAVGAGGFALLDPNRATSRLVVAADVSRGPVTSKAAAWDNVLPTLQAIAAESTTLGTPLFFDIDTSVTPWVFRTMTDVYGVDRTSGTNAVSIGSLYGNLANAETIVDWRDSATVVYAAGQGQESARRIGVARNEQALARSPWARRERVVQANQAQTQATVNAEAGAELRFARARERFRGTFVDSPLARYGYDFNFGDKVVVESRRKRYACMVSVVKIVVNDAGQETVSIAFDADEAL